METGKGTLHHVDLDRNWKMNTIYHVDLDGNRKKNTISRRFRWKQEKEHYITI
jgi:hypothetical protein